MTKLADTSVVTREITFPVPNVLIKHEVRNGFPILTMRQGGLTQVQAMITTDWHDAPVDENNKVFRVKAKNWINFGPHKIDALNDAFPNVAPSCPTASEYMRNVGKPVMTNFSCELSGENIYKVVRVTIVLP